MFGIVGFVFFGLQGTWGYWWLPVLFFGTGVGAAFMRGHSVSLLEAARYEYDYETDTGFMNGEKIEI